MRNRLKAVGDVRLHHPAPAPPGLIDEDLQGIVRRPLRAEPKLHGRKSASKIGSSTIFTRGLHDPVTDRGDRQRPLLVRPGFGMNTRRAGSGRYRLSRSSAASSSSSRETPYSSTSAMVTWSMPGAPHCGAPPPTPAPGRPCDGPCRRAHGTVVRGRPWPPGKAHAARLGPCPLGHPRAGLANEGTHQPFPLTHGRSSGPSLTGGCVVRRLDRYYGRLRRPPGSPPTSRNRL